MVYSVCLIIHITITHSQTKYIMYGRRSNCVCTIAHECVAQMISVSVIYYCHVTVTVVGQVAQSV